MSDTSVDLPRIVVTGVHSGPNPSAGLGVAMSLRQHFGDRVVLVGVDYGRSSSGLHSPVFDETVLLPKWDELDLNIWIQQLSAMAPRPADRVISTLDPEIHMAASLDAPGPTFLMPPRRALEVCRKPAVGVAASLGLKTPDCSFDLAPNALNGFLRRCPQGAWVRGALYEARRVFTVQEAVVATHELRDTWGSRPHIVRHVAGHEWSVAFVATDGKLRQAVAMRKQTTTEDGKTWSGIVEHVDPVLSGRLQSLTETLGWSGGGEIEMIRTWPGEDFLVEVNPRFPAWIHGATCGGANLPAALYGASVGQRVEPPAGQLGAFTRLITEASVNPTIGLPAFRWATVDGRSVDSKHPSDLPALARRSSASQATPSGPQAPWCSPTSGPGPTPQASTDAVGSRRRAPQPAFLDLLERVPTENASYGRTLLPEVVSSRAQELACSFDAALGPIRWLAAISIKTCPDFGVLQSARRAGFAAEAINGEEQRFATQAGFSDDEVILNGPAKYWRQPERLRCHSLFADSVSELRWLMHEVRQGRHLTAGTIGIRLTSRSVTSRFGERFDQPGSLTDAAAALAELCAATGAGWGVHWHHAQSSLGTERWRHEALAALTIVRPLGDLIGTLPTTIDLGGGWHPDDIDDWGITVHDVLDRADLPGSDTFKVIVEPGKSIVEPSGIFFARVLAVREQSGRRWAVTEASISDLSQAQHRPNPVARLTDSGWRLLESGADSLLGRSCIESDVLRNSDIDLRPVQVGDLLAFGMCGAYDASMSYSFGEGVLRR